MIERLQAKIERLQAKEEIAQKLAGLSDQKLERYVNRQRKILDSIKLLGFGADAAFAGSLVAISIGAFTLNLTTFLAASTAGGLSLTIAYATTFADRTRQRIMGMAENEVLTRPVKTAPKDSEHSDPRPNRASY